jgi:hypothetical protein
MMMVTFYAAAGAKDRIPELRFINLTGVWCERSKYLKHLNAPDERYKAEGNALVAAANKSAPFRVIVYSFADGLYQFESEADANWFYHSQKAWDNEVIEGSEDAVYLAEIRYDGFTPTEVYPGPLSDLGINPLVMNQRPDSELQ